MAALVGVSENIRGSSFPLEGEEISVGRRDGNVVTLPDSSVSGDHAQIVYKDNGWVLRDLGSTNGTRVNGLTVEETRLQERDQVQFGSVSMIFTLSDPGAINLDDFLSQSDEPDIELTAELAVKPETFSSHSPFAAQQRQRTGLWNMILAGIGALALLGVLALFYILFFT